MNSGLNELERAQSQRNSNLGREQFYRDNNFSNQEKKLVTKQTIQINTEMIGRMDRNLINQDRNEDLVDSLRDVWK